MMTTRRRVLSGLGGVGLAATAGCASLLGESRVQWERDDRAVVYSAGDTLWLVMVDSEESDTIRILDPADGSERRERTIPGLATFEGDGERVYGSDDEALQSFQSDGDDDWSTSPDGALWRLYAGHGTVVRVTEDGVFQGYDAGSGRKRWERSLPVQWRGGEYVDWYSVATDENGLVVPAFSFETGVATLSAFGHDGSVQWQRTTEDFETRLQNAVSNGETVAVVFDDTLLALDRTTGERAWLEPVGEFPFASALDQGTAYLLLKDSLVAFDAASGEQRWSESGFLGQGSQLASLVADDNGPIVSTEDGTTAYAADGTERWQVEDASGWIVLHEDLAIVYNQSITAIRRE